MQTFFKLFLLWACVAPCLHAQSNLTDTFDKLLAAEFKSNHPGAMVMVAKKGQVIYQKAFGLANVELKVPVSDSTIFYIASNTKQFTAVAILQLLEKGKLKLQDTLGQFIPNCPKKLSGISIQHLLSHTSGFADENTPNVEKITLDVAGVKSILLGFKPGTKWQYNNNNYALLGYIIETLSGQSYGDYLSENIFKPAGMINSYVDKELVIVKNRASGYTHFNNGLRNVNIPEKIGASGGMQSTVGDLLKWNRALQAGKLLKPETLKLAFTPQRLLDGQTANYGFGWRLEELQGSPTHRHGGLLPGHTSETLYLPNEDVYVVMLLNSESPRIPTVALARILASWAIDKPYSFTKVALDPNSFTKWTGLYENKFGELLNISTQNGQLTFQRPNGTLYTLNYAGNNDFFLDRDFLTVNFITNAAGQINGLQFGQVGIGATEWLRTKMPLLKLAAQRLAEPLLKQYTGKYYLPNQDTLFISGGGFGFYCQIGKQEKHLLAAEDDTHFFGLKENIQLEFVTEPTNKKAELWLMWNQQRKKYTKL